jgi:hypothetical protein
MGRKALNKKFTEATEGAEPKPNSTSAANAKLRKLRLGRADGSVALTTRARSSKEIRKFRARRDELQDKQYRGLRGRTRNQKCVRRANTSTASSTEEDSQFWAGTGQFERRHFLPVS